MILPSLEAFVTALLQTLISPTQPLETLPAVKDVTSLPASMVLTIVPRYGHFVVIETRPLQKQDLAGLSSRHTMLSALASYPGLGIKTGSNPYGGVFSI